MWHGCECHPGDQALRWRVTRGRYSHDGIHRLLLAAGRWQADGKDSPRYCGEGLPESTPGEYRYDEAGQLARGDQDRAAQESQGIICDRTIEHLGVSDKGVIMLRKLYKDSVDAIAAGKDPIGTIRDAAKIASLKLLPENLS